MERSQLRAGRLRSQTRPSSPPEPGRPVPPHQPQGVPSLPLPPALEKVKRRGGPRGLIVRRGRPGLPGTTPVRGAAGQVDPECVGPRAAPLPRRPIVCLAPPRGTRALAASPARSAWGGGGGGVDTAWNGYAAAALGRGPVRTDRWVPPTRGAAAAFGAPARRLAGSGHGRGWGGRALSGGGARGSRRREWGGVGRGGEMPVS